MFEADALSTEQPLRLGGRVCVCVRVCAGRDRKAAALRRAPQRRRERRDAQAGDGRSRCAVCPIGICTDDQGAEPNAALQAERDSKPLRWPRDTAKADERSCPRAHTLCEPMKMLF